MTDVLRVRLHSPVASFKDPMFPGVVLGLPVPPPSTGRGLVRAVLGDDTWDGSIGIVARSYGGGEDVETYQRVPLNGGPLSPDARKRPFLCDLETTLYIAGTAMHPIETLRTAFRRPAWGLRLGRSQDITYIRSLDVVTLAPVEQAHVGFALSPTDGFDDSLSQVFRLAVSVRPDRTGANFSDFRWAPLGADGVRSVEGALVDPETNQAVWLT